MTAGGSTGVTAQLISEGDDVAVVLPFDRGFVAKVSALPHFMRRWDGQRRVWLVQRRTLNNVVRYLTRLGYGYSYPPELEMWVHHAVNERLRNTYGTEEVNPKRTEDDVRA